MNPLVETVRQFLIQNQITKNNGKLLVAVSGGPDSVCLLDVLNRLKDDLGLNLSVAHLNHNLRGKESEQDANFVLELAGKYDLKCFVETLAPDALKSSQGSLQENAREARYKFLNSTLEEWGGDWIALGHHMDDQAETVLMNFLRGSGIRGLSGMSPVSGVLVRPLLGVSREEILAYLEDRDISACTDSSNANKDYLRNRVRADLIPLLHRDYNPNWKEHLAQLAPLYQEEDAYLEQSAIDIMDRELLIKNDLTHVCLSRPAFLQVPSALQYRIVREAYRRLQGHLKGLSLKHVKNAVALILRAQQGLMTQLPGPFEMHVNDKEVIFKKSFGTDSKPELSPELEFPLNIPGTTQVGESMEIVAQIIESGFPDFSDLKPHQALFDVDKAGEDLRIRFFRNGDRFSPLGMTGRKKLKDYFIDLKIPRENRRHIPLLTTASGDIIWVWSHQLSEDYKVSPKSKRICLIEGIGNPFPESGR